MADYIIRRLTPDDAPGVRDLAHLTWGDRYFHQEIYDPETLLKMNHEGRLITVVAVTADGTVIAHDALIDPKQGFVAETGMAMTHPGYRGGGIISQTRAGLIELAAEMGLTGVYGMPVTSHARTQHLYMKHHFHCAGAFIGLLPAGLIPHGFTSTSEPGRLTQLLYFRFLRFPHTRRIYPPHHLKEIITLIYSRIGADIECPESDGQVVLNEAAKEPVVESHDHIKRSLITLYSSGTSSLEHLERALAEQWHQECLIVYLPLESPDCPALSTYLEEKGFFFAAVIPLVLAGHDAICWMRLNNGRAAPPFEILDDEAHEIYSFIESKRNR